MKKNRLYIISLDAFGDADLEFAATLPNFKQVLNQSAQVTGIKTVYPSLTYVAHTSIVTGMHPKKHGIINNTQFQPNRVNPDWFWYADSIRTPTIFDIAKQSDYKICTLLWPVTGRSKVIDYNLVEIFPNRPWQNQIMVSGYASTLSYALEMDKKFKHLRKGIEQPELDNFVTAVAVDTILNKKPDLMAIHLVDLDAMRHANGISSNQARAAIIRMDQHLGDILEAMEKMGIREDTVLAILGDHYQIDTHTVIRPNHLFVEKGWITVNRKQRICGWKVIVKSAGGAAYIYRQDNAITESEILEALKGIYPRIEHIFTRGSNQVKKANTSALFMLEAKKGYYFSDELSYPFMETTAKNVAGRTLLKADHGFHPEKRNYTTMLLLSGPGINEQARIRQASLLDEAPTLLHAIGLSFNHKIDGKILRDVFI